jgi:predicted TIM-barrel fold metal-dependent hydrolase
VIIDTHTHVYPEKIAKVVEEMATKDVSDESKLYGPMTIPGLLSSMNKNGVDISLTFCVAEKAEVVRAANDFLMKSCDRKRIFGLGTIHPDFEDYEAEINRLRSNGIKGVKWNSLFQGFCLDDERMFRLYEAMGDDMIAYFHMGKGPGKYAEHYNSTPDKLARVLAAFPRMKVVAAHFGGLKMLEEVKKYLIGKNLYLDTSWSPSTGELDPALIADIVRQHGSDRIVFATDYPFCDTKKDIDAISRLPLSDEDKERIFWRNASELFGLKVAQ